MCRRAATCACGCGWIAALRRPWGGGVYTRCVACQAAVWIFFKIQRCRSGVQGRTGTLTVYEGLENGPTFAPFSAALTQSALPFFAAHPDTLTLLTVPLELNVTLA